MAALSRMANRDHQIRIVEGDTVILASSLIPGNENAVYRVINGLTRWGANVVHKGNAKVHVSGHASAGELLYFYNICKPSNLMPVHGEWRHLRANAELGAAHRRPARPHRDRRGRRRRRPRRRARPRSSGKVQAGYVYVDGLSVGDVDRARAQGPAHPRRRGLHLGLRGGGLEHRQDHRRSARSRRAAPASTTRRSATCCRRSRRSWTGRPQDGVVEPHQLQQLIRRTLGKWVSDTYRRRPMILPVVVEV